MWQGRGTVEWRTRATRKIVAAVHADTYMRRLWQHVSCIFDNARGVAYNTRMTSYSKLALINLILASAVNAWTAIFTAGLPIAWWAQAAVSPIICEIISSVEVVYVMFTDLQSIFMKRSYLLEKVRRNGCLYNTASSSITARLLTKIGSLFVQIWR